MFICYRCLLLVADDEKQRHITDVLFDDDSTDEGTSLTYDFFGFPQRMLISLVSL